MGKKQEKLRVLKDEMMEYKFLKLINNIGKSMRIKESIVDLKEIEEHIKAVRLEKNSR